MKRIEWNTDLLQWVWRIYKNQTKTSAFVPHQPGQRPAIISDRDYSEGLRRMEAEDNELF